MRRPFLPGASKADVPYVVVLVELDDAPGVRLVGRLREGEVPTVGARAECEFIERDGRPDLQFVLAPPGVKGGFS